MSTTAAHAIRAGLYCRISSDPRDRREGVDRQREDTADMCAINGWQPTGTYVDNDVSASDGGPRPEWQRLLSDIKAGELDAVVVWNQDRGWRKMAELESLRPIFEPRGVLLATTNIGVIDFRNADDVFRAQVSTAMSEMEVAKMKARMRRAAKQKAERGIPQWKRAFGYAEDYTPDPVTAPLVRAGYAAVLAGGSISDVAREWNAANAFGLNGKPWSASTVSLFLRKPRNAGLRAHNGEIVGKGNWPALVDENTWRSTQAVLNTPGRAPGRKSVRKHLLTGVLLCGKCGCHLSGGHTLDHRIAYRCKECRGVSVRAEYVEPLLHRVIAERLARPDAVDLLRAEIHDEAIAEEQRRELSALYGQIDQIAIERAEGLLTGRQAKVATDVVQAKIDRLQSAQQDAERVAVFDGLPLGTPAVAGAIERLSPDRYRAVIAVLMTITVAAVGKGGRAFRAERVLRGIEWRA